MRARRKRRGAPTSGDERAAGSNLVLGLALAIARLHTDKSMECAAAYRESDEEASSAWQADPEFGNALHLAYQMGETKPLRDFVKAGKSVPQVHVFVAGESIPMRSPRGRLAWRPSPATRAAIAAAPRGKRSASRRASRAQRCVAGSVRAERLAQAQRAQTGAGRRPRPGSLA